MKQRLLIFVFLLEVLTVAAQPSVQMQHALLTTTFKEKQEPVYNIKPAVDIPLTAAAAGFTFYGFSSIYKKDASSPQRIQRLDKADINGFDRWAAGLHSEKAMQASNIFFYGAMPLPLLLLAEKNTRSDAAKIGFLYLEAMSVTGVLYTGVPSLVDRYRPLTYSNEVPLEERIKGNNRNSFFAGHVALVATSSFFAAKVFSDYNPHSKWRHVFWGAAAVATGATGYLRHRAGKHFPSDILVGTAVGTLSGILVPQFHKTKFAKNQNLTVLPFCGQSNGVAIVYRLK